VILQDREGRLECAADPSARVRRFASLARAGEGLTKRRRVQFQRAVDPFSEKRERLFAESNLHLNRTLMRATAWDDDSIEQRGNAQFELARHIWRGPGG
jgi:hypothetical protein